MTREEAQKILKEVFPNFKPSVSDVKQIMKGVGFITSFQLEKLLLIESCRKFNKDSYIYKQKTGKTKTNESYQRVMTAINAYYQVQIDPKLQLDFDALTLSEEVPLFKNIYEIALKKLEETQSNTEEAEYDEYGVKISAGDEKEIKKQRNFEREM